MWLLLLEALLALGLLLFLVWWTMFSGRPRGEVSAPAAEDLSQDGSEPPRR